MKILTGYGHKFSARAGNIASTTGIMIDKKETASAQSIPAAAARQ